jgi:Immunity protein 26
MTIKTRRVEVTEGMVVAVPATDDNGYLAGVLARTEKNRSLSAAVLIYFFGPRHSTVPLLNQVLPLEADQAIGVVLTSRRRIAEGKWKSIGEVPRFTRADWPIPIFGRISMTQPGLAWVVEFAGDEVGRGVKRLERQVSPEEARLYRPECFSGSDVAAYEATEATKPIIQRTN